LIIGLAALVVEALRSFETEASAGTQQCNTECQSKMTDCILACDGMRSCEEVCKKKGQSCVSVCSSDAGPLPDAEGGALEDATDGELYDAGAPRTKDAQRRLARDR
jgi:hypothetical protein